MMNQFNPYYQQPNNTYGMYGYQPAPVPFVKPVQPLTQEEINHLRTQVNDLTNVSLTPDEIMKAKCTHKFKDGRYSLLPVNPNTPEDGDVVCEICGAQFNLNPIDEQTALSATAIVQNMLQQTKAFWPDIPMNVATDYMIIEPLLDKLANLYKVANDRNAKYMNSINLQPQAMGYANGTYGGSMDPFAVANSLSNGMYPMYGYGQPMMYGQQPMQQPQAPMGQAPMGQPMMYGQQPMGQAPMGQPMMYGQQPMYQPNMAPVQMGGMGMGGNPFGYESTMQQPQAPMGQAPVQQPAAPQAAPTAAASAVEVKKEFSL